MAASVPEEHVGCLVKYSTPLPRRAHVGLCRLNVWVVSLRQNPGSIGDPRVLASRARRRAGLAQARAAVEGC